MLLVIHSLYTIMTSLVRTNQVLVINMHKIFFIVWSVIADSIYIDSFTFSIKDTS